MVQRARSPYEGSNSRIEGILAGLYDLIASLADSIAAIVSGDTTKLIQRGTISIPGGATTATATITAVVMLKTELRYLGQTVTGDILDNRSLAYITLTNTTTVTATRITNDANTGTTISWEIKERN